MPKYDQHVGANHHTSKEQWFETPCEDYFHSLGKGKAFKLKDMTY